ncbi:SDR family NAD(P)-dependent oxidoreductase [Saccharothrix sp. Mg75]|uniref:SDR family NAD(P)-dependent oxidoreductase n=1 Tax=Saccharothrix sp. Mg75 TaxID=3445357 RepID=UPI003EE9F5E5
MHVRGMTALVTGASGGLGQAIARRLADEGATLVLTGRRVAELERVADATGARVVVADLADPADVTRLAEEAGEVDVLVANAALPANGPVLDFTPEQVKRALAVNLEAPITLTHALVPGMVARGHGHVVHIGSLAGKVASAYSALYNASKFGLRGFSLGLREDLRGTGVGVSVVEPGVVRDAGMFVEAGGVAPKGVRTVSPEQVADAVLASITRDLAEVTVAPPELKAAAALGGTFPAFSSWLQRRLATGEMQRRMAGPNRAKR